MHKDDLDRSKRPETKMAALGRDGERLEPSTRVLTVLARISERGCQTLFIRSITTKIEMTSMTCIHKLNWELNKEQDFYFSLHRFVIPAFSAMKFSILKDQRLAEKVSAVLLLILINGVLFIFFNPFVETCPYWWGLVRKEIHFSFYSWAELFKAGLR